jgi:predicted nucleotidyltransferase
VAAPAETPDAIGRLKAALADVAPRGLVSAYVFVSAAEGRLHASSDLDVGVLFDYRTIPTTKDRFEAQLDLRRHLSPAVIGRELDVVVLNDVSPLLGRRIGGEGIRVYCADDPADHAFRRDVQLRAADLEPFIVRMRRLLVDAVSR